MELSKPKLKLDFLDGIRGVACIYVALYHALLFTGVNSPKNFSPVTAFFAALISSGHYSVTVFIALSGFVLAIPVVRSSSLQLRDGFTGYIQRRARRILPPYYTAFFLFWGLITLFPLIHFKQNTVWDSKIPVSLGSVVSHLLLVHNLRGDWIFKVDGPMWSVATEWQIYFFFALIMIPLWQRFNLRVAVAICVFIGILAAFVPEVRGFRLSYVHPWHLGTFAFGAAAAAVCFDESKAGLQRAAYPWKLISIISAIAAIGIVYMAKRHMIHSLMLPEIAVGLTTSCLLLLCTMGLKQGRPSRFVRIMEHPFFVWLGLFSYSIYLIHSPLLGFFNLATLNWKMSDDVRLWMMVGIALPLAIFASYVFFLAVEKHFLSGHQKVKLAEESSKSEEKAVTSAV